MKRLLTIFLLMIFGIFSIGLVSGSISTDWKVPTTYSTSTVTSINLTIVVNTTDEGVGNITNVTWLNKSSSGGAYGFLCSGTATNTTQNDTFCTLKDKDRHWILGNITNATSPVGVGTLLSARIIDVDTAYYVLPIGGFDTVNITLNMGDINVSGYISTAALRLKNGTRTTNEVCDAANEGMIKYNTTGFYGCYGATTDWRAFRNATT